MRVLFKCEVKQVLPLPPEQSLELGLRNVGLLSTYQQEGKIASGGVMAGRRGSCAIFEVDSMEELQQLVTQLPLYPFLEVEIIPLVSFDSTIKGLEAKRSSISSSGT